jgi:hypothetical protein
MALARLIADLEDNYRPDVLFMFTARFDTKHDNETVEYVSKKFPVIKYTTKRKAEGWPNGPNQMMACSYEYCVEQSRWGNLKDKQVIMFIEADCVPLHKNWINILLEEYKKSGKMVTGAWLKRGDAGMEHINGNCLMSLNFWKKCKEIFHPDERGGWDCSCARSILPNGHPSRFIWSDYQLGQAHNPWRGCDFLWEPKRYGCRENVYYGEDLHPVWFHGIKVMDGINCVRERLLKKIA